ncbi:MAG: iron-sulfur cluster assembly scaffold protein [Pseudomonadota bacterium]
MTLYNNEILKLATSTANFKRLPDAQASVEKRSSVCGSRVTVDVRLDTDGAIDALGLEVRACALGQASAALMAAHAHGRSVDELNSARDALAAFLADTRADPGTWPGLLIFAPAIPHRARHASILLAFDAVAEAAHEAAR